jgi:mRNA deadenylase 3'-5' endonuclease subunit Ccr4/uncharacterized protein with PIN domain
LLFIDYQSSIINHQSSIINHQSFVDRLTDEHKKKLFISMEKAEDDQVVVVVSNKEEKSTGSHTCDGDGDGLKVPVPLPVIVSSSETTTADKGHNYNANACNAETTTTTTTLLHHTNVNGNGNGAGTTTIRASETTGNDADVDVGPVSVSGAAASNVNKSDENERERASPRSDSSYSWVDNLRSVSVPVAPVDVDMEPPSCRSNTNTQTQTEMQQHDKMNVASSSSSESHGEQSRLGDCDDKDANKINSNSIKVKVKVLSFNVLAEAYLTKRSHPGLPLQYGNVVFDPIQRQELLMQTLRQFASHDSHSHDDSHSHEYDILCLQEVDLYDEIVERALVPSVWGSCHSRIPNRSDRCCIFWRKSVYQLVEHQIVEFDDLARITQDQPVVPVVVQEQEQQTHHDEETTRIHKKDDENNDNNNGVPVIRVRAMPPPPESKQPKITTKSQGIKGTTRTTRLSHNKPRNQKQTHQKSSKSSSFKSKSTPSSVALSGMANSFLRRNAACLCVLEHIQSSTSTQQKIAVCSAHLYWNPGYEYVKLAQSKYLVDAMHALATKYSTTTNTNDTNTPNTTNDTTSFTPITRTTTTIPVLVCGDFNSKPGSATHTFLSRGSYDARKVAPWRPQNIMARYDSDDDDGENAGNGNGTTNTNNNGNENRLDAAGVRLSVNNSRTSGYTSSNAERNAVIANHQDLRQKIQELARKADHTFSSVNTKTKTNVTTAAVAADKTSEACKTSSPFVLKNCSTRHLKPTTEYNAMPIAASTSSTTREDNTVIPNPTHTTHHTTPNTNTSNPKYMLDYTLNKFTRWLRILGLDAALETSDEEQIRTQRGCVVVQIPVFEHCRYVRLYYVCKIYVCLYVSRAVVTIICLQHRQKEKHTCALLAVLYIILCIAPHSLTYYVYYVSLISFLVLLFIIYCCSYYKHACRNEGRILLTTSAKLLQRKDSPPGAYLIDPRALEECLCHLLRLHGVVLQPSMFLSRCVVCNGTIVEIVDEDDNDDHDGGGGQLRHQILEANKAPTDLDVTIFACDFCLQCYWWSEKPNSSPSRVKAAVVELFQLALRADIPYQGELGMFAPCVEKEQKVQLQRRNLSESSSNTNDTNISNGNDNTSRNGKDDSSASTIPIITTTYPKVEALEWLNHPKLCHAFGPALQSAYADTSTTNASSGGTNGVLVDGDVGESTWSSSSELLPFTNVTSSFVGCLDYIFYDPHQMQLVERLDIPTTFRQLSGMGTGTTSTDNTSTGTTRPTQEQQHQSQPQPNNGHHLLPSDIWPSDHLAIGATFLCGAE